VHRRSFLAQLALVPLAAGRARALPGAPRRRLLCFTKSSGWVHSVVKPGADGAPSLVDRAVTALGAREGFDVVCTKDGGVFTDAGLRAFDAFLFFTSEDLAAPGTDGAPPMPPGGKDALLRAVRGGKGFVGVHSASDTFHTQPDPPDRSARYAAHGARVDPYVAMLGGEFASHGPEQPGRLRVVDPRFPGASGFAGAAPRMGEWYSLKDFAPDLHVVLTLDTAGMRGSDYARGAYPVTWARRHGRGRVFYTAMGHREEEWADPAFLGLLAGGARWAFGDVEAAVAPNLAAAAPRHAELPPRPPR
jgi:type 1 glutamine amidotransferase